MNKVLLAAVLAASLAVASGCADRRDGHPAVMIAPTIKTRVTGLHFDTGDRVGLTILKGAETYVANHPMTYEGSAFSGSGLLWYSDLNAKSTLTAYYPYSEAGVPAEFSVAVDQTGGCASSDLLGAVTQDVTPGSAPVGMLFYHLMSQLTVVVTNNSDAAVSSVAIGGFVPTATVDLTVPTAAAKAGAVAAEVRAFEVTAGASYRVVLVPQQAALTVTVGTADGSSHSKTIPSALLESGKQYDMSVTVTNTEISVSLSGDISDWGDGGSLDGGGGGDADPDAGELVYEGETYPTVKIDGRVWMAENLRYAPPGATTNTDMWPSEKGLSSGMLYTYATAMNGASVDGGTSVQGICPTGWHIPTAAELQSLAASADRPAGFLTLAGFRSVNSSAGTDRYGDLSRGYLMGCDLSGADRSRSLFYTSDSDPAVAEVSLEWGLPLRCVKD